MNGPLTTISERQPPVNNDHFKSCPCTFSTKSTSKQQPPVINDQWSLNLIGLKCGEILSITTILAKIYWISKFEFFKNGKDGNIKYGNNESRKRSHRGGEIEFILTSKTVTSNLTSNFKLRLNCGKVVRNLCWERIYRN